MTPEELLRPRVIIENKWPNCPYVVGDILTQDGDYYWVVNDIISWYSKIPKQDVEPYPYLMRPLKWWEERKPEDMPPYVKGISNGAVIKVEKVHFSTNTYLPATEAEYLQYVKTLNQQQ